MTTQHSPLPWHDDGFSIIDGNGDVVCIHGQLPQFPKEQANRTFIIHDVNSHAALLAAAREMLSAVATRDIGSFTWESRAAKSLRAAIDAAEESA